MVVEAPPRPVFQVKPAKDETWLEWSERFYRGVEPVGILTRKDDGTMWLAPPGLPPSPLLTLDEFRGRLGSVYDVRGTTELAGGRTRELSTILPHDPALVLYYSEARKYLPTLNALLMEPAVIEGPDGSLEITPPGYDRATGIWYYVRPGEDPILPRAGTEYLTQCFSAVPFERVEYRNNLLAWLLGAVFFNDQMEPPMLVITGNARGIGKSKTMESAGMILTGQFPAPVDHTSDEFEKQLSARFREGQRFVGFDNIVTGMGHSYKNDRLARMLTQGWSKKVRILGHSRTVEAKGVLFALTANDCKLDADLATRSLPIKLYCEDPKPMVPFVRDFAQQYRREIYGELLSLALQPGDPIPDTLFPGFRFRRWLGFVYPRIKAAFGNLAVEEAQELDDAVTDLAAWGYDVGPEYVFSSKDLLERAKSEPDKLRGLTERFYSVTSDRSKTRLVTVFLKKLVGQEIPVQSSSVVLRCVEPGTSNTPPAFAFYRKESAI